MSGLDFSYMNFQKINLFIYKNQFVWNLEFK